MPEDLAAIDTLLRLTAAGALVAVALLLVVLLVVMMTAHRVYGWPQHPPLDRPVDAEAARRRVLLAARMVRAEYGPYAEPGPNDGLGQAVLGLIEALDDLDQVIEP